MNWKAREQKAPTEKVVKNIGRETRRSYRAEEKIRIVLEDLSDEDSIATQCGQDD